MGTWIGVGRTNSFRVKDVTAFKLEMERFLGIDTEQHDVGGGEPTFTLFSEEGSWPDYRLILDPDTRTVIGDEEIEFAAVIAEHLPEGEIAVFHVAGFEKARYLTGYSFAVNSKGEVLEVSMDDIYGKVKDQWGVEVESY